MIKWKIYRVLNYIQLVYAGCVVLIILFLFIKNGFPEDYTFLLIPAGFLVMAANNYCNLFIFSRYFPNKLIPSKLVKLNIASFIASIVYCVGLIILIIAGTRDEFSEKNRHSFSEGKIALGIFFLMLAQWVYILYMQTRLRLVIRSQHYLSITNVINSIGEN
jgi:hypothetical protein